MIDRAADQGVQVLSLEGRAAADQDFGLVPDLLAAAGLLGSPPAAPTLPSPDEDILGGLTLEELEEILPPRPQVPAHFDAPWASREATLPPRLAVPARAAPMSSPLRSPSPPLSSASCTQSVATPALSGVSSSVVPRATSAEEPVQAASSSASTSSATVFPAAKTTSRVIRPSRACAEDDAAMSVIPADEIADPYSAYNLLRNEVAVSERPVLPSPPERHPSTNCFNHYDPAGNHEGDWNVRRLLDRGGSLPHLYYLVEWNYTPLQMTYEWPESLRDVYWCMNQVNAWIAAGRRETFNKFYSKNYRKAGASDSNWCFLHALEAACFGLGRTDLVTRKLWNKFCLVKNNDFAEGVDGADVDAFLNFLRAERVSLDYVALFKQLQSESLSSTAVLERHARTLDPGHYIVHAAEHSIEHYFTLVVTGPKDPVMIYDDYSTDKEPPCSLEPLQTLGWLTHVFGIRLVAIPRPKRSKKSKKSSNKKSRN